MVRFLRIFIPAAVTLMAICYSYYLLVSRDVLQHAQMDDASLSKLGQQLLEDEFRSFTSDLITFSNLSEWKNIFGPSKHDSMNELAENFKSLLLTKKSYEQIRLIGLHGKELLRVDFHKGRVKVIPDNELQNKSHRYYIKAAESLHDNQIYISPMDLNRENGKVVHPLDPSIRLITPVFDARGQKRGLLVLNVLVDSMMQRFIDKHAGFPHRCLLVNRQGEWLHGSGNTGSWDFLLAERRGKQFSDSFPEAWSFIGRHEHGQFFTKQGMFTFSTFHPLRAAYRSLPNNLNDESAADLKHEQPVWKIIEYRSHVELADLTAPFVQRIARFTVLFLLLMAVLVWRISVNIGKKEKVEQQLRDSEYKFRHLIEDLPASVGVIINAKVAYANKAATILFCGNSGQSIVGKPVMDFVHLESQKMVANRLQAVMNGQMAHSVEEHFVTVDGNDIFALVTSMPIEFEGKRAVQTVIRDITEQHRAEKALKHKKMEYKQLYTMLRMLCDNMPDMMWAKDLHQRYIFANKSLCDNLLHAESTDEPIGKADMFFAERERNSHPDNPEWHTFGEICRDSDAITLQSGQAEQFDEFGNVRGEFLFFDVHKAPMLDANGDVVGVVGSARNVTEMKAAEVRLRTQSQAIEQAGEAVMITDCNAVIEYVNPAFSKVTGYSTDEVIGQTPAILNSGKQDDSFYQRFWQKITSGETWHGSMVDQRKDGSLYPAMISVSPILDADGCITHYVSIQQDMSEHEELEEKFRQAQKMEALGTLVGGIAHDFNNVLAGMLGNLYLVKKQTANDAGVQTKLHRIEQAGQRAADMIRQLLAFARKGESELSPMPVQPFIKEILKLARSSIPENIALQYDLGSQDYLIRGDGSQMQQMMLNLLVNASHALEGRHAPVITVSMHLYKPDDDFLFVHREIDHRPLLCITVADNGSGISKANLEHVFEPFFTTKEEGKGTGLGLAMVYGSMQNHGGIIDVESEEGSGTRMKLYFPLSDSNDVEDAKESVDVISGKDEVILLADDNDNVREIMQEILRDFGYRVVAAENGKQALMMYVDHASEIKLALLDIVMPVMGGVEAAKRLRELNPDLPILFLSGYEKGASPNYEPETDDMTVLTKPVDLAELSHYIHKSIR